MVDTYLERLTIFKGKLVFTEKVALGAEGEGWIFLEVRSKREEKKILTQHFFTFSCSYGSKRKGCYKGLPLCQSQYKSDFLRDFPSFNIILYQAVVVVVVAAVVVVVVVPASLLT